MKTSKWRDQGALNAGDAQEKIKHPRALQAESARGGAPVNEFGHWVLPDHSTFAAAEWERFARLLMSQQIVKRGVRQSQVRLRLMAFSRCDRCAQEDFSS